MTGPTLRRVAAVTVAAGTACVTYGVAVERRWYALRSATAPLLGPDADRPLRILHLSDLHQLPGQDHRLEFVRRCADLAADLVVVTGDLLEADEGIAPVVRALGALTDGRPGLAVLGSHDFWGPTFRNPLAYLTAPDQRRYGRRLDTRRLIDGLEQAGYEVLHNRRCRIDSPAGPIDVLGLGDPHLGQADPDAVDWAPPDGRMALRLGLVHAPYRSVLDRFDRGGFQLVLSGHTHGGQVRLPGVGALTNNSDLPLRQSRGLSRYGEHLWLHVSAGLGHSRFAPFRFACRPEVSLLDLVDALPVRPLPTASADGHL